MDHSHPPRLGTIFPPVRLLRLAAPSYARPEVGVNLGAVEFPLDVLREHLSFIGGPAEGNMPQIVDVPCAHRVTG